VRLVAERAGDGWQIAGFPVDVAGVGSMLLVADPFTFPSTRCWSSWGRVYRTLRWWVRRAPA
jgi:hypothetical protein